MNGRRISIRYRRATSLVRTAGTGEYFPASMTSRRRIRSSLSNGIRPRTGRSRLRMSRQGANVKFGGGAKRATSGRRLQALGVERGEIRRVRIAQTRPSFPATTTSRPRVPTWQRNGIRPRTGRSRLRTSRREATARSGGAIGAIKRSRGTNGSRFQETGRGRAKDVRTARTRKSFPATTTSRPRVPTWQRNGIRPRTGRSRLRTSRREATARSGGAIGAIKRSRGTNGRQRFVMLLQLS